MAEEQGRHSVTGKRRVVTVAASPFNAVKYELGILLLLAVPVGLLVVRLVEGDDRQLGYLLAYGGVAALWLILRARHVLRRQLKSARGGGHGA